MPRVSAYPMVRVDEALEIILAHAQPLGHETVELTHARGRVLAHNILADDALPGMPRSSVDGYAEIAGVGVRGRRGRTSGGRAAPGAVTGAPGGRGGALGRPKWAPLARRGWGGWRRCRHSSRPAGGRGAWPYGQPARSEQPVRGVQAIAH